MGEKLLTIEDIAQAANVAKSTVSRVLNNSGYVGKETRKRVEKVIAESNYTPWVTARNLSKQMSNTIGVVVSEITNPYFARAFEGISEVIDKNDMNIIFCNTDRTPYKEEQALRMLREKRVRGIIISPVIDYDVPEKAKLFRSQLESISAPTVLLDAPVDLDLWDGVFFDNFDGAYHAVKAMISSGHRQIGIITGDRKNKVVRERYRGYIKALKDSGLKVDPRLVFVGDYTVETAYRIGKSMIQAGMLPPAIFTANNFTTIGFIKACIEEKVELEKDVSVMAFDKLDEYDIFGLKYNRLERDPRAMGRMAAGMLVTRMQYPDMPRSRKIIPSKIVMCR